MVVELAVAAGSCGCRSLIYNGKAVFNQLTAFGRAALLSGILMVPGVGDVDFCLARQEVCNPALEVAGDCCSSGSCEESETPCCVTVHWDWMVPTKGSGVEIPVFTEVPGLMNGFQMLAKPSFLESGMHAAAASPDPPPRRQDIRLALIRVRLI